MGVVLKTEKRRIIPRWRSIEHASSTGELDTTSAIKNKVIFNSNSYLLEQRKAWTNNKTLSHAGDLLSSAFVLGLESEFKDAAKFILDNELNVSSPLLRLAKKTLGIESNIEIPLNTDDFFILDETLKYRQDIRKYRHYLKLEPRNPIAWIELGRLYSLLGNIGKGQTCIDRALFLDNANRFIARSSSRFYQHFHGDKDISIQIIKNAAGLTQDPWLLSADIAYSSLLGRYSRMTKIGREFVKNYKKNFLAVTELNSALGSVDLGNGLVKDAKKYFKQSLISPNDNSLAQMEWVSINGLNLPILDHNVPLAFEASAISYYEKKEFAKSFECGIQWYYDEPYSTGPILLTSYIAGTLFKNKTDALRIIKKGLKINPSNAALTNNLIYYLALDNQIEEAIQMFERNKYNIENDTNKINVISSTATAGLLFYKINRPLEGKKMYMRSIELAKDSKINYLVALAALNYLLQEIKVEKNFEAMQKLIYEFEAFWKGADEADIIMMKEELYSDLKKLQETSKEN